MRFESLTLFAFGAFRERTVPLAPGMNVVYGPNEAGKSTWHAAAYAALCGIRRGRGLGKEERAFEERHRPWTGREWQASAILSLADGRRVELRQDLASKAGSRAVDLALGRDVSGEILSEGTPDGSRWLGLDRRAFAATACVRQADVLAVTDDPDLLTDHLQRAAAASGTDATAVAALHRIDEYRREHVGKDRAGSVRPLRRAGDEVLRLTRLVTTAREEHAQYVRLAAEADRLQRRVAGCQAELDAHRAALASSRATQLASRLAGAEELATRRPRPPGDVAGQELALRAMTALRSWRATVAACASGGPTAEELRAELAALPERAQPGDLQVDAGVREAARAIERARDQLDAHRRARPGDATRGAPGASEELLRELVHELEVADHPVDPTLLARREAAEQVRQATEGWFPGWPAAAGIAFLLGAGLVGGILRGPMVVAAGWSLALALAAGVAVARSNRRARAEAELSGIEHHLAASRLAAERRRTAAEKARQLGLPDHAPALREMAEAAAGVRARESALREWERGEAEATALAAAAEDRLWQALAARGAERRSGVQETLEAYELACRTRSEQAERARRRRDLAERLQDREAREQAGAAAERELRQAALEAGIETADIRSTAAALEAWQEERRKEMDRHHHAAAEWSRLQELLGGRTLPQLREEATAAAAGAAELERAADPELVRAAAGASVEGLRSRVDALRRELEAARGEAERTKGQLEAVAGRLPSVPDAEEALERARAELARIQDVDRVLDLTQGFLEAAQEQVHRDVAPLLATTLRQWLPGITAGRYTDAIVDPRTLDVMVCGPRRDWRDAGLLSQGTREQVYLLLRIALVERLTRGGESCPLLLDEVTVHSDTQRTAALLGLLHEASQGHQILLFTQEDHVADWARANLTESRDQLLVLKGAPVLT
jgi:DNA repair protein SbcC/Rad50